MWTSLSQELVSRLGRKYERSRIRDCDFEKHDRAEGFFFGSFLKTGEETCWDHVEKDKLMCESGQIFRAKC